MPENIQNVKEIQAALARIGKLTRLRAVLHDKLTEKIDREQETLRRIANGGNNHESA